jgi:hypothetical protein
LWPTLKSFYADVRLAGNNVSVLWYWLWNGTLILVRGVNADKTDIKRQCYIILYLPCNTLKQYKPEYGFTVNGRLWCLLKPGKYVLKTIQFISVVSIAINCMLNIEKEY